MREARITMRTIDAVHAGEDVADEDLKRRGASIDRWEVGRRRRQISCASLGARRYSRTHETRLWLIWCPCSRNIDDCSLQSSLIPRGPLMVKITHPHGRTDASN
jgi:hypothetical protein